jgi:hypothetical protein
MALWSTQPLVKMITRYISLGVKAAGAWGWPHHLHVPNVLKIGEPKPPGTLWATQGLLRDCFTFYLYGTLPNKLKKYTFHQISWYNIIKDNGWGSNAARMGYTRDTHNYDAKPKVNRPNGRHRWKWVECIKIYLQESGQVNWIQLVQFWGPVVGSHEHSDQHFRFLN